MGFYNLNPDAIRDLQPPDPGVVLRRDGSNLASVLRLMAHHHADAREQIRQFLAKVVPGVTDALPKEVGKQETLEFRQQVGSSGAPWRFPAESMSDGALRALGVLTALFQTAGANGTRVPLVGLEEPEAAVHPGAAGVRRDALRTAAAATQVLVGSHSAALLDDKDIGAECLLGVASVQGETKIGPLGPVGQSVLRDRAYTAGELLGQGQLMPDLDQLARTPPLRLGLFGDAGDAVSTSCGLSGRLGRNTQCSLAAIVEGHGEVEAVPILVRRVAAEVDPQVSVEVRPVLRVLASKPARAGERRRTARR